MTKVVLNQRVLHGSNQPEFLQRVATVYIYGKEYRVSAPPEAKGDALDWLSHLTVRQLVDLNSEVEIHDAFAVLVLKVVKEELERHKRDANGAAGMRTEHEPGGDGISGPLNILKLSIKQVPANKYAFGVVGVVAAAAISIILVGGKWQAAIAGGVVMLAGMAVLRVFSAGVSRRSRQPDQPLSTQALTWFCIVAFAVVLSLFIGKLYVTLFPSKEIKRSTVIPPQLPTPNQAPNHEASQNPTQIAKVKKEYKTLDGQRALKRAETSSPSRPTIIEKGPRKQEETTEQTAKSAETQGQNSRAFDITLGEIVEVSGVQPTELADNDVSPDTAMGGVPVPWSFSIVVKSGGETRRYDATLRYDVFQRKLVLGRGQGNASTILSIPVRGSDSVEVTIVGWANQDPDRRANGWRVLKVGGPNLPIKVPGRIPSKKEMLGYKGFSLFFAVDVKEAASQ
jgi:hypothetical protein